MTDYLPAFVRLATQHGKFADIVSNTKSMVECGMVRLLKLDLEHFVCTKCFKNYPICNVYDHPYDDLINRELEDTVVKTTTLLCKRCGPSQPTQCKAQTTYKQDVNALFGDIARQKNSIMRVRVQQRLDAYHIVITMMLDELKKFHMHLIEASFKPMHVSYLVVSKDLIDVNNKCNHVGAWIRTEIKKDIDTLNGLTKAFSSACTSTNASSSSASTASSSSASTSTSASASLSALGFKKRRRDLLSS